MKRLTTGVLAIVFGLLNIRGGCGPGLPPPEAECLNRAAPGDGAETVVVGLGANDTFMPLNPEEELFMEFGPQGGQHVFISLEYYAKDHTTWQHEYMAFFRGTEIKVASGAFIAEPCTPGWNQIAMLPVFVDTPTTAPVRLEVVSGPTEEGTVVREVETAVDVRFVNPT
ncbi:MAG: hypothetical protein RIT81_19880 [Deltaproteobacteria bacterium]